MTKKLTFLKTETIQVGKLKNWRLLNFDQSNPFLAFFSWSTAYGKKLFSSRISELLCAGWKSTRGAKSLYDVHSSVSILGLFSVADDLRFIDITIIITKKNNRNYVILI